MRNDGRPLEGAEQGLGYRVGLLKSRIAADADDAGARRELVGIYRELGHPDQAGRYAVAIDGFATREELHAYVAMLRGLHADELRMRALSRLPRDAEISTDVRNALEDAHARESGGLAAPFLTTVWAASVASIVATPVFTFIGALMNLADVRAIAVVMTLVATGVTFVAAACTAIYFAVDRSGKGVAGWLLCCLALAVIWLAVPR